MNNPSPPELNPGYVCITTKDDPVVSALISSYFSEVNTYFIVFTFPDVSNTFRAENDSGEDDLFAQAIGAQAAIRINNVIARLRPRTIILGGMSVAQKSFIRALVPLLHTIEVDNWQHVEEALAFLPNKSNGVLPCKSSDVVQALVTGLIC